MTSYGRNVWRKFVFSLSFVNFFISVLRFENAQILECKWKIENRLKNGITISRQPYLQYFLETCFFPRIPSRVMITICTGRRKIIFVVVVIICFVFACLFVCFFNFVRYSIPMFQYLPPLRKVCVYVAGVAALN